MIVVLEKEKSQDPPEASAEMLRQIFLIRKEAGMHRQRDYRNYYERVN